MSEDPQNALFNKILMLYLPWTLAGIFFTLYVLGLGTARAEERNREAYLTLHQLLVEKGTAERNLDDRLNSFEEVLNVFTDESSGALNAQNTALNLLLSDKDLSYLPRDRNALATTVLLWADYQRNTLQPMEREMRRRDAELDEAEAAFYDQVVRMARELYYGSGQDATRGSPVISAEDANKLIPLALRESFDEEDFDRFYNSVLKSYSQAQAMALEKLLSFPAIREILTEKGVTISGTQQNFSITFWPTNLGAE